MGLFVCNYIFKLLIRRSSRFSDIVQDEKIVIVVDGKLLQHGLQQAMIPVEEVQMAIREHGVDDISKANLTVLEVDGNITVLLRIIPIKQ